MVKILSQSRTAMHHLLALVLVTFLFGCSEAGTPDSEPLGSARQVLVFPLRITLATPQPLAPTAPALVGSNSVRLGAFAEVTAGTAVSMGSGGLQADPDAVLNETWSRGTAVLRDRVRLRNTLHARTRSLGSSVVIPSWDANPAFDPASVLSWDVSYPSGAASNFTLNDGEFGSITPGLHGIVTVNSQAVMTLEAGTYYLTSLVLQSGSTIRLDQSRGPIIIYVTDSLALRGSFVPVVGTESRLLLAYLGTTPVVADRQFDGALIAPSTSLTLRSVTGVHTGYFYARDLVLDAGARVRYRTPAALVTAAGPDGPKCRELIGTQVPEDELFRYCPGCRWSGDADRDGIDDCIDECDYDELKTKPGACGCGIADVDADGDGVPNCLDDCDLDPNNTSAGQCGCSSSDPNVPGRLPAGTQCTDTGCPQSGTPTCNGSGVCGNRSACVPASGCRFAQFERSSYWFCPGPVTQSAAAQACRNKQMALARIDGFSENTFIRRLAAGPLWIGANSITTGGTWRWATPTSNNGDQFWAGAANGSQRNSLYSFWSPASPAAQRCAVLSPSDGRWTDVDCNQAQGFVCEFGAPLRAGELLPPAGRPDQPPAATSCTSQSASRLPPETDAGFQQLLADQAAAASGVYQGAAANPPAQNSNTCLNLDDANAIGEGDVGEGCVFTPSPSQPDDHVCFDNADCAQFGANLKCRQIKNDPTCEPTPTASCPGFSRCGTLSCPASPTTTCQQVEVCNPGTEFTPTMTGSDLTAEPFDPAALFGGTLPPATPAATYVDPPQGSGKAHSWCFMSPQQAIPDAVQPEKGKQGQSGSASPIRFSFDPNLTFEAKVNPLSLGETDLDVHARAELVTRVTLEDFIGVRISKEILSAVADIRAQRCTIRNDETQFKVFGRDFAELTGVPKFNTSSPDSGWYEETTACNQAVGAFVIAANRAKKAFRDVQQLLTQYQSAKQLGSNLRDLCQTVMALAGPNLNVPNFPDLLDCPENEAPETTINRFIDYYQAPAVGEIARLRHAIEDLSEATKVLREGWNTRMKFGPKPKTESQTVARTQFMMGPVPLLLEIDVFYSYGVAGFFDVGLHFPYDPFSDQVQQKNDIARVKAGVMPYANAGVSAFVGAGRSLGPLSASVGIEGAVTLGDIKAPIFAGAGVGAEITQDQRPLAADIAPLAGPAFGLQNLTHFGKPKAMKFYVWFNYGAALEASDVLRGEVNARLRVRFAFFSRTWRTRIVKFNGLSPIRVDLVSGKLGTDPGVSVRSDAVDYRTRAGAPATGSTQVVEGTTDVGHSEQQLPLLVLERLPEPAEPSEPSQGESFDATEVGSLFYDGLCCAAEEPPAGGIRHCLLPGERAVPGGPVPCCPGLRCLAAAFGNGTACYPAPTECRPEGERCSDNEDCCSVGETRGICDPSGACQACGTVDETGGSPCDEDSDCCLGEEGTYQQTYCDDSGHCAWLGGT